MLYLDKKHFKTFFSEENRLNFKDCNPDPYRVMIVLRILF